MRGSLLAGIAAFSFASGCATRASAPVVAEPSRSAPIDTTVTCDSFVRDLGLSREAAALIRGSLALHRGRVVRWRSGRGSIQVWIRTPPGVGRSNPDHTADRLRAVVVALDHWSGTNPGVRFEIGSDSAAADLRVHWMLELPNREDAPRNRSTGRSGLETDPATGEILTATVMLAEIDRAGREIPLDDIHMVAGHEVGHSLGLAHQTEARSAMQPTVRIDGATNDDRAAVRAWYALPLGRVCRPSV